jgi:hypothetical protein
MLSKLNVKNSPGGGDMPEKWDPAKYRKRAKAWREKAASLPETDPNRMACLALADGYERRATQLEDRVSGSPQESQTHQRGLAPR